jgi:hypothetical protein
MAKLKIFEKQGVLKPSAMVTVAERRFEDAQALCATRQNARANGAAYLAGFVIEILLKARLVRQYETIARKRQHDVKDAERGVWSLIWRSHDLGAMLDAMPELEAALKKRSDRAGENYLKDLKAVCAAWTIQARYSPFSVTINEAGAFLERVRTLKELLK